MIIEKKFGSLSLAQNRTDAHLFCLARWKKNVLAEKMVTLSWYFISIMFKSEKRDPLHIIHHFIIRLIPLNTSNCYTSIDDFCVEFENVTYSPMQAFLELQCANDHYKFLYSWHNIRSQGPIWKQKKIILSKNLIQLLKIYSF